MSKSSLIYLILAACFGAMTVFLVMMHSTFFAPFGGASVIMSFGLYVQSIVRKK